MQVGDHRDAIFRLLQADEGHLGARHVLLRRLQELRDFLVGPDLGAVAFFDHARRIGEARMGAGLLAQGAMQVRAGAIGAAGVDRVAGLALGEDGFAGLDVGHWQHRAPIDRSFGDCTAAAGVFGDFDGVARLLDRMRRENARGNFTKADDGQTGRQHRANDFVERKVAHSP